MPDISREQFFQEVLRVVPQRFPLVKLTRGEAPFSMRVYGQIAGLENLYRQVALNPQMMRQQIERWIVELLRASDGSPDRTGSFDELRGRILPMILADEQSQGPHRGTLAEPLVPGLHIAYAIDSDRSIAYITREQFKTWNVSRDELHDTAIENLCARSEAMNAQAAQDESGQINFIILQASDGYDASRILLPTLHDRLREHLGSPFVAAIPNRDMLMCFRNDQGMVAHIGMDVREAYRRMPHQVSERLFLITADGIAPRENP